VPAEAGLFADPSFLTYLLRVREDGCSVSFAQGQPMNRPQNKADNHCKPAFAMALAALGLTFGLHAAHAQDAAATPASPEPVQQQAATTEALPTEAPKAAPNLGKPFYIEFRSRSAQSYGHTFSIYGRLNGGKIASKTVAGLHPVSESPLPWMIGHFVLVPSETGASDGDTEDQYVTARFRVTLSQDEYKKVTGYIKGLQQKSPVWHAVLYNCNAFVGDIARFMGLETPSSTMLMPAEYINELRTMNISRTNLAGVIGTMVKVDDAAKLRADALKAQTRPQKPASPHGAPSSKPEPTGTSATPPVDRHSSVPPASGHKS
jgi:hypothetical protein